VRKTLKHIHLTSSNAGFAKTWMMCGLACFAPFAACVPASRKNMHSSSLRVRQVARRVTEKELAPLRGREQEGVHFMTRVTRGFVAKKRRKRVLKLAKGFRGSNSVLFRTAQQRTLRALSLAYRDRRLYKRTIRSLWIRRINSFLRDQHFTNTKDVKSALPTSYSSFIHQLKKANILLNRKVLAQLAVFDPMAMKQLAQIGA